VLLASLTTQELKRFTHLACHGVCLQDALNDAEDIVKTEAERNGIKFYDYEIQSPVRLTSRIFPQLARVHDWQ
jgi:hypothetical protein